MHAKFTSVSSSLSLIRVMQISMTRSIGARWAQLLVGGPSGLLGFVLLGLRALRPCDPHEAALDIEKSKNRGRKRKFPPIFPEKGRRFHFAPGILPKAQIFNPKSLRLPC